jgi:hypothetical protein
MKIKSKYMPGRNFGPVPAGKYIAEIVEVTPSKASTGTDYLFVDLLIIGPSHQGRHVFAKLFLTDKAGWKLSALLHALGEQPDAEIETESLIGRPVGIDIKVVDGFDGSERNEISRFRKISESGPQSQN